MNSIKWFILKLVIINYRNVRSVLRLLRRKGLISDESYDRLRMPASNAISVAFKWIHDGCKSDDESYVMSDRFCRMFKRIMEGAEA